MLLRQFAAKLVTRLLKRRVDLLFAHDLAVRSPVAISNRLIITAIGPEHHEPLLVFVHKHHVDIAGSIMMIEQCYREHYQGYVALLDGEIVGYRWWVSHDQSHPHLALYGLALGPGDVYTFGLYIARPFRGQGFALELVEKMLRSLAAQGHRRNYSAVMRGNEPSWRLHVKLGDTEVDRFTVLTLFSRFLLCRGRLYRCNPLSL